MTIAAAPSAADAGIDHRLRHGADPVAMLAVIVTACGHQLATLLSIVARLLLPVALATGGISALLVGRQAVVRNGELVPVGWPPGGRASAVVMLVALGYALVVTMAASALAIAGELTGRPVSAGAACRAALRRSSTIVGLLPAAVVVGLPILVLLPAPSMPRWPWVLGALVAVHWAIATPVAVLERRGLFGALRRVGELTSRRRLQTWLLLLLGLLPVHLLTSGLPPELAPTLVTSALLSLTALAAVPFQSALLTVLAIRGRGGRGAGDAATVDLAVLQEELAHIASSQRRRHAAATTAPGTWHVVALAAALAAPGLLLTACARMNPLDLAVVSQQHLQAMDDDDDPDDWWSDIRLHLWGPRTPLVVAAEDGPLQGDLIVCRDPCRTTDQRVLHGTPLESADGFDTAMPQDGTLAVAAWVDDFAMGATVPDRAKRLLLFTCRIAACEETPQPDAATLDHQRTDERRDTWPVEPAIASSGGRVAVAYFAYRAPDGDSDPEAAGEASPHGPPLDLRLALCEDVDCAHPRLVTLAQFHDARALAAFGEEVAVTFSPDGRPVVAFVHAGDETVSLAVCDTSACAHPTVSLVRHAVGQPEGLAVAVPAHGRPVIAYTDTMDEEARILTCTTFACDRVDAVALARTLGSDLALDADGHVWVATYDGTMRSLLLLRCDDDTCAHRTATPVARTETHKQWHPGAVDLAIGSDGRPRIAWIDVGYNDVADVYEIPHQRAHVVTCEHPGCRPE